MDRAMNKLKKFFKLRSRNQSLYSQVEDYDHLDDVMRERRHVEDEVRSHLIDFGGMAHYDSVWTFEDNQVRNLEEIVPVVDENLYSEVEESGSSIMEHDTPYVMVGELSSSSQGNVSEIICTLVKERFKEKLNNLENTYETLPENVEGYNIVPSISELSEFGDTINELKKELKIQQKIIVQSKKALQTSAHYNFNGKIEEMEARRFLLIAETRSNMIEERIRNVNMELEGNGVVKFKNFRFSKKSMNLRLSKVFTKQKPETRLWFMILVSYGKVLTANRVLEESDHIVFEDELVFERLLVDFDISMYLYSVSLKKDPKKKSIENYWDLVAKFDFIKENLKANDFVSDEVSDRCPLSGAFEVDVQTDVKIGEMFSAFLDIKTHWKGENIWSRSWCILKGSNLMFYKYPGDEAIFYVIDLRKCKKVDQPDRSECARRKSLVLQTKIGNGVRSDYISADSWELINEWESNIKNVLQLLKDWS